MKIVSVHAQVEDDIDEWSQEDSKQQEVSQVVSYEEMCAMEDARQEQQLLTQQGRQQAPPPPRAAEQGLVSVDYRVCGETWPFTRTVLLRTPGAPPPRLAAGG